MKLLLNSAMRCNGRTIARAHHLRGIISNSAGLLCSLFILGLLTAGCAKQAKKEIQHDNHGMGERNAEATVLHLYSGLSWQTSWELQQARAASARYRNFDNAIKDGYVDINVVLPEMGYHYLKGLNLDGNFDFRKPEILVYNKDDNDRMQLVAVEYAVPIALSPNQAPEGFTGSGDVWDKNEAFGLWLLHAWVWHYNPNGVFNPTNPSVHVH